MYFHQHLKAQTEDKLAFCLVCQMVNYDQKHVFSFGPSRLLLLPDPLTEPAGYY